jgi:hypothetical protein
LRLRDRERRLCNGINPWLAPVAMVITQDLALRGWFRHRAVIGRANLPLAGPLLLAPTHRARWDALMLPHAAGRRVSGRDCRFMVTVDEMKGLQGWFLHRLGCFAVNQSRPSMASLRYAVDLLASTGAAGQAARVGVVGLDDLPWSVAEPLFQAYPGARLVDASALFAAVRQPADAAELGLARQALAKAQAALNGLDSVQAQRASAVTTTLEHSARLAGAEELLQRLAPDLSHSPALQRMEGDMALGSRWAVEVSLAYKGVWVRCTESRSAGRAPASWADAEKWFAMAAAALSTGPSQTWPTPPGQLVSWTLEACTGAQPLVTVAALHRPAAHALPAGSLAVFSVQLEFADGPWHFAAPVVLGSAGQASELLHA